MTQTYATYERGAWRCYVTPTGRGRAFIGCAHLAPASAVRHVANLDPFVSPLPSPTQVLLQAPSPRFVAARSGSRSVAAETE